MESILIEAGIKRSSYFELLPLVYGTDEDIADTVCDNICEIVTFEDLKDLIHTITVVSIDSRNARFGPYLQSTDWKCRKNSSLLLQKLVTKYSKELHDILQKNPFSDGILLSLDEIDIAQMLVHHTPLLAGYDHCYEISDNLFNKDWLRDQRRNLRLRIGIESSNTDVLYAVKYQDAITEVLNFEDICYENSNYHNSAPPTSSMRFEGNNEHWLIRMIRNLIVGILDPKWEVRDGCSKGLSNFVIGMIVDGISLIPTFLLNEMLCTCLCALLLDRFIDVDSNIGNGDIFPIKVELAQLLAVVIRSSDLDSCHIEKIINIIESMLTFDQWIIRFGAFCVLKHVMKDIHICKNDNLIIQFYDISQSSLCKGLCDDSLDVRLEACRLLSQLLLVTKDLNVCFALEILEVLQKFWDSNMLNITDAASINNFLVVIRDLVMYEYSIDHSNVIVFGETLLSMWCKTLDFFCSNVASRNLDVELFINVESLLIMKLQQLTRSFQFTDEYKTSSSMLSTILNMIRLIYVVFIQLKGESSSSSKSTEFTLDATIVTLSRYLHSLESLCSKLLLLIDVFNIHSAIELQFQIDEAVSLSMHSHFGNIDNLGIILGAYYVRYILQGIKQAPSLIHSQEVLLKYLDEFIQDKQKQSTNNTVKLRFKIIGAQDSLLSKKKDSSEIVIGYLKIYDILIFDSIVKAFDNIQIPINCLLSNEKVLFDDIRHIKSCQCERLPKNGNLLHSFIIINRIVSQMRNESQAILNLIVNSNEISKTDEIVLKVIYQVCSSIDFIH